jgi:hypothetical protein
MKRVFGIALLAIFSLSCATTHTPPKHDFPTVIAAVCEKAMYDAKVKIEADGTPLPREIGVKVTARPGEQYVNGIWGYIDSKGNLAGGECNGSYITIAVNPNNPADINYAALRHEFCHYWLITNHIHLESAHDPKYADVW